MLFSDFVLDYVSKFCVIFCLPNLLKDKFLNQDNIGFIGSQDQSYWPCLFKIVCCLLSGIEKLKNDLFCYFFFLQEAKLVHPKWP